MHKKFFMITTMVLAVAAGLTASVFAQEPGRAFGHRHGGMLKHMTRELNLTEAQQTQIKGIMADSRTRIKPLMQQLRQNEQAQNANINTNGTGVFDEVKARTFANQQAQIMSNLIVERQRTKSQIYSVLTPDQRQKALQLMQQHEQRRQERLQKKSGQSQQTQDK
jgi:protein CpxP